MSEQPPSDITIGEDEDNILAVAAADPHFRIPDDYWEEHIRPTVTNAVPTVLIDYPKLVNFKNHFDPKDRSEPLTLRLSAPLLRVVDIVLTRGGLPYHTKSDFFRDSGYYLVRTLHDMQLIPDKRVTSYLKDAEMAADLDFTARLTERVAQVEHDLCDHLIGVVENNDIGEAVRTITEYLDSANAIPVPHWRSRYLRRIAENPLVQTILAAAKAHGHAVPNII